MNPQLEREGAVVPLANLLAQTVDVQIHPDANSCQLIFFASKEWKRLLAVRIRYESDCSLGQAANATTDATCGSNSEKQTTGG